MYLKLIVNEFNETVMEVYTNSDNLILRKIVSEPIDVLVNYYRRDIDLEVKQTFGLSEDNFIITDKNNLWKSI